MRRNGPAITLASSSPATTASASASDPTSANVRSRLSCASSTGLSGSAICSVPTRRPCSAIGRVRTRIRPASSTSAVVVPSAASMTPPPLLTCAALRCSSSRSTIRGWLLTGVPPVTSMTKIRDAG